MESQETFARSLALAVQNHRTDVERWEARDAPQRHPTTLFAAGHSRRSGFEVELANGQVFHVVVTRMAPVIKGETDG